MAHISEPPIHPDDTSPSLVMRPAGLDQRIAQARGGIAGWRRTLAWLCMLGAAVFMFGTIVLLLLPDTPSTTPPPAATTDNTVAGLPSSTTIPTTLPTDAPTATAFEVVSAGGVQDIPIMDVSQIEYILQTPVSQEIVFNGITYDPYTVIKTDRPRSVYLEYTIIQGDTIDGISKRFNLKPESIAWCNDRRIIFVLRVGDVLKIPPVDGVCHQVLGTREETPNKLAQQFKVANVYDIIDFPLNNLYGRDPDSVLPGGLSLFIPGGQAEAITWNPGYTVEKDENGVVRTVTFAQGQAGSCGTQVPGAGAAWRNPLPTGKWVRGFYAGHTGIDLSSSIGTPVYAANSGPVLFSGFSRWGYGETVVLSHGYYSSLYAHMSQRNARCGDNLTVGNIVGLVGSTGNSTGPHLHFEIRVDDTPVNPSGMGTGW
jgi:murein DD-endopeptidase MepM/ murein hydrolase activator NlpD